MTGRRGEQVRSVDQERRYPVKLMWALFGRTVAVLRMGRARRVGAHAAEEGSASRSADATSRPADLARGGSTTTNAATNTDRVQEPARSAPSSTHEVRRQPIDHLMGSHLPDQAEVTALLPCRCSARSSQGRRSVAAAPLSGS